MSDLPKAAVEAAADAQAEAPKLKIEYRPVQNLTPNKRNARLHSKKQLQQLVKSYQEFGFISALLTDENGRIIAGHGRWQAAKLAGIAEVPVIMLSHLTEQQKIALSIADNKIPLGATWSEELLSQTLKDLSVDISFNLELTGFTAPEIDLRLSPKSDASLDRAPAYPKEPRTKLGDIIVLGPHRIVCGDARDAELMGAMMGGVKADAAVLDLPYNIPIDGFANRRLEDRTPHAEFAMACGEMSSEQFVAFLSDSLKVAVDVSRNGAVHFNFMDWRHSLDLRRAADPLYGELLNLCFWNKSNGGLGCLYRSKHEQVYVYRVGDEKHYNSVELGKNGRNRTNVWDYPSVNTFGGGRDEDRKLHPTIKPIALVADAIKDVTKRGDVVLDTFMGSGTTLLAAEREDRVFRGAEIDPGYIDIAIERWVAMTGGKPKLSVAEGWNIVEKPYDR